MLVGRSAECARIDGLLERAQARAGGALVLRGEAGIGKSTLLDYARSRAGEMTVLAARGVESESELPFASLYDVLRPLLPPRSQALGRLPAVQRGALRAALGLARPVAAEPVVTYAATLTLLVAAAEGAPVLVLVDDAQWLDDASAAALGFAARRLGDDRVAMLFALRAGEESALDPTGLPALDVHGLPAEQARRLLEEVAGAPVSEGDAQRLVRATGGNPLALRVLGAAPSPAPAGEGSLPGAPPRTGAALEAAFLRRLRGVGPTSRFALLVAAASDTGDALHVARGLTWARVPGDALAEAERSALVRLVDGRVEFGHPLVRSVAYHTADPAQRRLAHRALAHALVEDEHADRRAWHLAAAAVEPDEEVALELAGAAARARARGGLATAGRALERAARLSPEPVDRVGRLLDAADAMQLAGQLEDAARLLEDAGGPEVDGRRGVDVARLRGRVEARAGTTVRASRILIDEAERVQAEQPVQAALLLTEAADPSIRGGRPQRALEIAERACRLAAGDSTASARAQLARGTALIFVGRAAEGDALIAGVARSFGDARDDPQMAAYLGMTLAFAEQPAMARPLLEELIDRARGAGMPGVLPYPLVSLAWIDRLTGRWGDAAASLSEAAELTRRDRRPVDLCWALSLLASIDAAQGAAEACRSRAEEQLELDRRHTLPYQRATAHAALGLLALGEGRHDEAVEELEQALEVKRAHAYSDASTHPSVAPDLVEALVRAGRRTEAARLLDGLAGEAAASGRASALAGAARCRGLTADDDGVDAFEDALRHHERALDPFARARTELCYGERLHRANRRGEARRRLESAHDTFRRLGAQPWAARVEALAARASMRRERDRESEPLTDSELRLAALVAEGKTNKEIASTVWVSPKTVEAHLGHVFAKLGLRNRQELTRWWLQNRAQ